jgi:colicin import membrane protein
MEFEAIELTDLVAIEPKNALTIFAAERTDDGHPIDPILAKIRDVINAHKPNADVSTDAGRAEIRTLARRIASAKVKIEEVGKDLSAEQKKIPKLIDATRKHVKDTLDSWRDEVRAPLTEWEAKEDARVDAIKQKLEFLQTAGSVSSDLSVAELASLHEQVSSVDVDDGSLEEYQDAAKELKEAAIVHLTEQHTTAMCREADAAELAALRAEAEKRKALEEEADRKAEEERRMKAAADAAVLKERQDAAAREAALVAEKEAAEKAAAETEARIKREADEAAEAQRAADAKRAADVEHRRATNRAAVDALVAGGITETNAQTVISMIVAGKVPNVSIKY